MKLKLNENWKETFSSDALKEGYWAYLNDHIRPVSNSDNSVIYAVTEKARQVFKVSVSKKKDEFELTCSCNQPICEHQIAVFYELDDFRKEEKKLLEQLDSITNGYKSDEWCLSHVPEKPSFLFLIELKEKKEFTQLGQDLKSELRYYKNTVLPGSRYEDNLKNLEKKFRYLLKLLDQIRDLRNEFHLLNYNRMPPKYSSHKTDNINRCQKLIDEVLMGIEGFMELILEYAIIPLFPEETYHFLIRIFGYIDETFFLEDDNVFAERIEDPMIRKFKEMLNQDLNPEGLNRIQENYKSLILNQSQTHLHLNHFLREIGESLMSQRQMQELNLELLLDELVEPTDPLLALDDIKKVVQAADIMRELGYTPEKIDSLLDDYRNTSAFLEYDFRKTRKAGDYEKALEILKKLKNLPGNTYAYHWDFVDLYEKLGQTDNLISELKALIEVTKGPMNILVKLLYKLESILTEKEWNIYWNEYARRVLLLGSEVLVSFYWEKQQYDNALKILVSNPISFWKDYYLFFDSLAQRKPVELRDATVNFLNQSMEKEHSKNTYIQSKNRLLKLKDLPDGKKIIRETMENWKEKYPDRKDMIEILDEGLNELDSEDVA